LEVTYGCRGPQRSLEVQLSAGCGALKVQLSAGCGSWRYSGTPCAYAGGTPRSPVPFAALGPCGALDWWP
jgi:hypothetical protein